MGWLGQLAGGFVNEAEKDREMKFRTEQAERQRAIGLSTMLIQHPATPPEYKELLANYAMQAATGKKVPDFQKEVLNRVPATFSPAKVSNVQQPQLTLRPPPPPPGPSQPSAAPTAGPSGDTSPSIIGQSSAPMVSGAGPGAGIQPPSIPPGPMPSMTIPGATGTVTLAPQQISPAGQFHMMSPEEIAQREQTIQMNKVMETARLTGKTPAEIMGIKPDLHNVSPGSKLVDSQGVVIAEGGPPPAMAAKEKYAVDAGPGGEIRGIIDNTGQRPVHLSPEEASKIPEAAKLLSDAQSALESHEKKLQEKATLAFSRQLAIQAQALNNAIQRGAVDDAKKAAAESRTTYSKVQQQLNQDEARYNIMQKAYDDAQKNPDNVGSFDAALLAFHMGMTVGSVKGMRTGKDLIMLHEKARSLPEDIRVAAERWVNGSQLSDEQRQNFLKLAQDKMDLTRADAMTARSAYERSYGEYRDFVGGVTKGKTKVPEKAPGATAPQSFSIKAPNGKTYTFQSQQDLDNFKKAAGITQ